jgi:hypothetical protein
MSDGQFQDFLNPKSMLTPGFAGGLTVLINNALAGALGVPGSYLGYTALVISALFAMLVLVAGVPLLQRLVFYVLNTLIIFCVAMGSNTTVRELRTTSAFMLVTPAYAGSTSTSPGRVLENVEGITGNPTLSDAQKLNQIQQQLKDSQSQGSYGPGGSGFFRNWSF